MNKVIHQKIALDMTPKKAFQLFVDNEKLKTWLVKDSDVETFVGGKYELFWDTDNKSKNSTIGCKITAFEKNKLLGFEWKGPVQFADSMNNPNSLTHVTISFIPVEKNTEVHLIHSGWQSGPQWKEARTWFKSVWANAFDHLKGISIK